MSLLSYIDTYGNVKNLEIHNAEQTPSGNIIITAVLRGQGGFNYFGNFVAANGVSNSSLVVFKLSYDPALITGSVLGVHALPINSSKVADIAGVSIRNPADFDFTVIYNEFNIPSTSTEQISEPLLNTGRIRQWDVTSGVSQVQTLVNGSDRLFATAVEFDGQDIYVGTIFSGGNFFDAQGNSIPDMNGNPFPEALGAAVLKFDLLNPLPVTELNYSSTKLVLINRINSTPNHLGAIVHYVNDAAIAQQSFGTSLPTNASRNILATVKDKVSGSHISQSYSNLQPPSTFEGRTVLHHNVTGSALDSSGTLTVHTKLAVNIFAFFEKFPPPKANEVIEGYDSSGNAVVRTTSNWLIQKLPVFETNLRAHAHELGSDPISQYTAGNLSMDELLLILYDLLLNSCTSGGTCMSMAPTPEGESTFASTSFVISPSEGEPHCYYDSDGNGYCDPARRTGIPCKIDNEEACPNQTGNCNIQTQTCDWSPIGGGSLPCSSSTQECEVWIRKGCYYDPFTGAPSCVPGGGGAECESASECPGGPTGGTIGVCSISLESGPSCTLTPTTGPSSGCLESSECAPDEPITIDEVCYVMDFNSFLPPTPPEPEEPKTLIEIISEGVLISESFYGHLLTPPTGPGAEEQYFLLCFEIRY